MEKLKIMVYFLRKMLKQQQQNPKRRETGWLKARLH